MTGRPLDSEALRSVVSRERTLKVCHLTEQAPDGILPCLGSCLPGVVILDLDPLDRDVISFIDVIRRECPATCILLLTDLGTPSFVRLAMSRGANAIMPRDCQPHELLQVILSLRKNECISTAIMNDAQIPAEKKDSALDPLEDRIDRLTCREFEVFFGIAHGQSLTEIAAARGLSARTVEFYRTRVITRLGVKNSHELTRVSLRWILQQQKRIATGAGIVTTPPDAHASGGPSIR